MSRVLFGVALAGLIATSCAADPIVGGRPQLVEDEMQPEPPAVAVSTYVDDLDTPWSLVFLPDGRGLVSERPGRIRLIDHGRALPVGFVESVQGGEAGLMGLALHPQFPQKPYVYAMHTYRDGNRVTNRVIRLIFDGVQTRFDRVILAGLPAGRAHDGGRIAFGPDGYLYIGTGETFEAELAQDMSSLGGKVLRVTDEGAVPPDNPFPGSPIYTLGHRNVQGLAWDPHTGELFESEHGPSGELGVHAWDEINVLQPGRNYGWPRVVGAAGRPEYVDPIVAWPGLSAPPGGITFWKGDLYVPTLRSQALIRIHVEKQGGVWQVQGVYRWFAFNHNDGRFGRLRDAVVGPDAALYVLTSNRDGRGRPREGDDRILRIANTPVLPGR
jgi:glucose/arabinose dehydrogenase